MPSALTIGTIVKGVDGYATITNGTAVELDLSRWYLKMTRDCFYPHTQLSLPANTLNSKQHLGIICY